MKSVRRILDLLGSGRRGSLFLLLALMFIGMLLETASIGLFIPALALMTEPDIGAKYPMVNPLLDWLGNPDTTILVTWGLMLLIVVYVFKNLFLGFLAWWQARFVFDVQAALSQKLFDGYLRQPYAFHLQRNSAELIRNVTGEVLQFTVRTLLPLMTLVTEGLVLIGISCLLLFVEPLGAVVIILALGVSGCAFYLAFKSRLVVWGEARQYHDGQRIKHLQQGLGGAKDVILMGREEGFLKSYDTHNKGVTRYSRLEHVLQYVPRLFLETLAVAGLAILILTMLAQGRTIESLIPTVGLFGAAAFRLMPVANRVLGSMQRLRFSLPVVNVLHSELAGVRTPAAAAAAVSSPFVSDLTLKNVGYAYPDSSRTTLHDVNLTIKKGSSVGFVGESGAGKSTLIDTILGLLTPSEGVVLLDGVDIQENLRGWQKQIGYVSQSIFLTDDTLRRNIAFGLADDEIDEKAIDSAIAAAQLQQHVDSLPDGKDTIFGERGIRLSGGQIQRIGIARALYHDPQVLVLDEATSALDTATERSVLEAIEALHGAKTIIIVTHRLSTVERCDELFRLEHGRIGSRGNFADVAKPR